MAIQRFNFCQLSPAFVNPNAASAEPGIVWKAMLIRFQALIVMTENIKSEISCSENCSRTRLWMSSGKPCSGSLVKISVHVSAARSHGRNSGVQAGQHEPNGQYGVIFRSSEGIVSAEMFHLEKGLIHNLYFVRNPDKLKQSNRSTGHRDFPLF